MATRVVGRLEPGVRVAGLTARQLSAIDAMEHMVDELGLAAVRVSTWTIGIYDVKRTRDIRTHGRITDIRMLLDRGTFEKSPKYAGPLIEVRALTPSGAFRSTPRSLSSPARAENR